MSTSVTQTQHPLFPTLDDKATVQVHAFSAGHLTLPEKHSANPASDRALHTVPSLAFLIQHVDFESGKRTRILFDLGLSRDLSRYSEPTSTDPGVVKSLTAGGLTPADIDYIILPHLRWHHIGTPSSFPHSTFIVAHGALSAPPPRLDPAAAALLPLDRTIELSAPSAPASSPPHLHLHPWHPCPAAPTLLPHTLDLFADSSLLLVAEPAAGHLTLLARTGPARLLYLAACTHAAETAARLRDEVGVGVEVVGAHDAEWARRNGGRFWGAAWRGEEDAEEEERA